MVHGQGHCFWSVPVLEQAYRKVGEAFCWWKDTTLLFQGLRAMSRCFPFPPPRYEKKARIEDTNLLTKEKHKEKKHKKDKKGKREGKEKKNKDKERSKEKHSNKYLKEKHKDKKDGDKDKDKNWILDAKRIEWQTGRNNGDKIGKNSQQNNKISDSECVQDLARRIMDDDRATGSQIDQKIIVTDHRRGELPGRMVECSINNRLEEEKAKDKKVNGQRNHIEVRSSGNAILPGFSGMDQKKYLGVAKPVEKNDIDKQVEEKEKNKLKESYNKHSKHMDRYQEKKYRSKDESSDKEKEEKAKELSEKSNEQLKIKIKDNSPKLKDMARDREKKSRSKEESSDKEKEEDKAKEVSEKSKDQLKDGSPKLRDSSKGVVNSCSTKPLDVSKMGSSNPEGILGKRKELEINGISHDNGNRPHELLRPVSYSHQVMENGRKLEPCRVNAHLVSECRGEVHNCKVDMKERKINGLIKVPRPIVSSSGSLSTKSRVGENDEASVKPQHPHSKYLNQILSVPQLEDSSDLDDQEWLLSRDSVQSKKSKVSSPETDKTQEVWAEALQIESANLTALPYVVPF